MKPSLEQVKANPGIYKATFPSGRKTYKAVVSYRAGDGSHKQTWTTWPTLRGAQVWRRDTLVGISAGARPGSDRVTVKDFLLDRWLPAKEPEWRPLTMLKYRGVVEGHVVPNIGGVKLRDLDDAALEGLYSRLPTPSVRRAAHAVLSAALGFAVRKKLIRANPCTVTKPPKVSRPEARHLDPAEARRMLDGARSHRLEPAVILGLVGGLRLAEVCAMRWSDLNFQTGWITVERSFHGPTKSGKARAFRLPPSAVADLKRCRREQAERLFKIGVRVQDDSAMVATVLGGQMGPRSLEEGFARFCQEHAFDINFHGLRHSCTVALLLAGVDVRTVAGQLGHSNPGLIWTTYGHYVRAASDIAAERLDATLYAESPPSRS